MATHRKRRLVVPDEELESVLQRLLAISDAAVEEARKEPNHVSYSSPRKPDVTSDIVASIREALEDEVTPAVPTETGLIARDEIDHEVTKKALLGLRLFKLRTIAREREISPSGGAEELATRIAREYRWDDAAIAKLILANEEEPRPEHEFTDRLFPIYKHPGLDYLKHRLEIVAGRYIRVGVAKWFVFNSVDVERSIVTIQGYFRSYNATVDETREEPTIGSVPFEQEARIRITDRALITVRAKTVSAARGAMSALYIAGNLIPRSYVVEPNEGISGLLRPASVFMLDLLFTRLRNAGLQNPNCTVARFSMDDRTAEDREDDASRPALRAVRFEGTHLLDSVPACRLLVRERRPLTDISVVAETAEPKNRFPLRIAVESDHVRVSTGFGVDAELAMSVHLATLAAVRDGIEKGVADGERLKVVIGKVQDRANAREAPTQASVLVDETSPDDA